MLLKSKKISLLVSTLFIFGYANAVDAGECGVLRYLANKSNGVAISGNTCQIVDEIALGSEFNLTPGARLWFKSQKNTGAKIIQGICQNRSSETIRINVDSDKSPWIKPISLSSCSSWAANKMNCNDSKSGKNALSCVLAIMDAESHAKGLEERTTSVRMRTLSPEQDADADDNSETTPEAEREQIVSAMQPDISLCRDTNQTSAQVKMTWRVEPNGEVKTIVPGELIGAQNKDNQSFVDCIGAVIKDFNYPQSAQGTWLSSEF